MRKFGLLGRNISYSFSKSYFSKKFREEGTDAAYENFDLPEVKGIRDVLERNPALEGFNVTIPYKEEIILFLDELDPVAGEIGAVNTVKVSKEGKLVGFNTDYFGFCESIRPYLNENHKKALILGTGGASKAIAYGLESMGIPYKFVSRNPSEDRLSYDQLSGTVMQEHQIIINCTPLGTSPKTEEYPALPIHLISPRHLVFDLIYNPSETRLMKLASGEGATTANGLRMLELQAEKAWEIWNS